MKLFFRRLAIYYKNHIDAIPLILFVLALVVFTFGIYSFSNTKLESPRWPWDQSFEGASSPIGMMQFMACLFSMLGVLALMNYRTSRNKYLAVIVYIFAAVQIIYDIYYISEIYRHMGGVQITADGFIKSLPYNETTQAALAYTYTHLIVLSLGVILLALSPLIQKYTSKIKLKPISLQDKDIEYSSNDISLEDEESSNRNQYGYSLDDLDDEFVKKILEENK